jgi:FkbM family methyltransferase
VVEEWPVETRRLDDVAEIAHLFLKIDVQGAELTAIRSARGNSRVWSPFRRRFP